METRFLIRQGVVGLIVAGALASATAVFAQVRGDQDWKIGPYLAGQRLRQSDVVVIPINHHFVGPPGTTGQVNPPHSGWAGFKFTVHVLDNTELDVDSVAPFPLTGGSGPSGPEQGPGVKDLNPFGPRSNNVVSQIKEWKVPHPTPPDSGIDVFDSHQYVAADLEIHVKGTSRLSQNSDTDLVVQLWNIWHFRQGFTSQIVTLKPSDRIWVGSNIDSIDQLVHGDNSTFSLPPTPPVPPMSSPVGHWFHAPTFMPFHFFGSQYYATLADTITVGIDHVPEPATLVLFGLGLSCAVMGVRSRLRRS